MGAGTKWTRSSFATPACKESSATLNFLYYLTVKVDGLLNLLNFFDFGFSNQVGGRTAAESTLSRLLPGWAKRRERGEREMRSKVMLAVAAAAVLVVGTSTADAGRRGLFGGCCQPACCPAPEPVCCPAPAPVCCPAPAPVCCPAPAPTCCPDPCCDPCCRPRLGERLRARLAALRCRPRCCPPPAPCCCPAPCGC